MEMKIDPATTGKLAAKVAAAGAVLLAAAPQVFAQGCAMCYTEAAAQGPRARRSLDLAILVLLIPAVSMFAGVFLTLRRRDRQLAGASCQLSAGQPAARTASSNPGRTLAHGISPTSL
jgi:hypothetical protein